jgi:hypothetical protein
MNLLEKKWRKGGMTSNGLRRSTEVVNYFYGPGRMNIIPDATNNKTISNHLNPISSIGIVQTNGLGQVASSTYGPGTLNSSNVQVTHSAIRDTNSIGSMLQNDKRTQFVDFRHNDPVLVENLRKNPLSIYSTAEAKQSEIPAFYSYVRPDNYDTYTSVPNQVNIQKNTIIEGIDGSPQINILGLDKQNPFLGLTHVVNDKPLFLGKTYGGKDNASAKPFAENLYNQIYTTNTLEPVRENFNVTYPTKNNKVHSGPCKNKALVPFMQGYNVAPQIIQNKMVNWVGDGSHAVTNLPWGPRKITGNPQTQQGGIWTKGNNPNTTLPVHIGYSNRSPKGPRPPRIPKTQMNCYKNGLPGSLVCS